MIKSYVIVVLLLTFNLTFAQLSTAQKDTILAVHNFYRSIIGVRPLIWSDNLAEKAQQWADAIAKHPLITHNSMGFGQNLFYFTDTTDIARAVHFWAMEQKYYYGQKITQENKLYFQHYTQIIWAKTKDIGCGLAKMPSGLYVLVCFYAPAGNVIGESPLVK